MRATDSTSEGSSRLSAYLRFGCLSPLEVEARVADRPGGAAFIRQLAWRDFFRQLLASDPTLGTGGSPTASDRWRIVRAGCPRGMARAG